ncbi:hypothetical protein BDZ94DRAFT_1323652 [Collybia nuda]|uniref:MADS-box domain-containing protein n=1 Tax=Collybia nuda TaxID=64659 RepID=A0A9P5Y2F5_9AGAR|nr:hypothetical protein BDZ94DRAFT_1323652 [Collybia nuda]
MGRRKIEIQPITHERNRSVTFLKRRNGLFKKAYELGVLCSVDIAVIIFEERPGHSHKLFQYGSSNVQDIIQRRLRYDGEMDSRGPSDFSGGTAGADIDEADEEDIDEDPEDILSPSMRAKRKNPKSERVIGEYQPSPHLGISIPLQHQAPSSSSIPTSSDRFHSGVHDSHHSHQSKRPRIGSSSAHPPTPHSPYSGGGHVSPRSAHDRPSGGSSYRDLPSVSSSQHQSFGPRPSSSSYQYPFFQSSQGHHSPPTPSFIPLQPEFSLSSRSRGRSSSGAAPFVPRTSGYETSYTSRPTTGSGNGDIFANIDSGRGRSGGSFGLDWPVHSQHPTPPSGPAPPRIISSAPSGDGGSTHGGGATDISRTNSGGTDSNSTADWLDFLSGAGNGTNPPGSSSSSKNPVPPHIVGGRPPSSSGHAG